MRATLGINDLSVEVEIDDTDDGVLVRLTPLDGASLEGVAPGEYVLVPPEPLNGHAA